MPVTCLPLNLSNIARQYHLVEFNIFLTFNVTQPQFENWLSGLGTVTELVGIDEV